MINEIENKDKFIRISPKIMHRLNKNLETDEMEFLMQLLPYFSCEDNFLEQNDERLNLDGITKLMKNYTYDTVKKIISVLIRNCVLTSYETCGKKFYGINDDAICKYETVPIKDEWMGFVYFIQAGNNGAIKIGYTKDVDRRIKELQTSNPEKLNLLLKVGAEPNDEKVMHDKFKKYCINLEWYSSSEELLNYIKKFQIYSNQCFFDHNRYIEMIHKDGTIKEMHPELKPIYK